MNDLSSTPYQIFMALIVFLVSVWLYFFVGRYFGISKLRSLCIFIWHTLFCFIFFVFILNYAGDATMYYKSSFFEEVSFGFGTRGILFLNSFLTQGLGLSFIGCSLVFHFFGAIGLIAFDASLQNVTKNKSSYVRLLATSIVFLPSISFWSSGLGKDSLSFFSMGLALWSALAMSRRWPLLLLSMMVMLIVRPHMAGVLGFALGSSFVFQRRVPLPQRFLLGGLAIAGAAFLLPFGLNYAGVGDANSFGDVVEYVEERQAYNQQGGGAVDISGMSPPVQMFTYLFRPTLIEVRNLFSLAAAIDNTILLFLFFVGGWALIKNPLPAHLLAHNRMFLWIYSLGAWLILAMTTANLGIALRQKWMFVPMLIFLLISVIGRPRLPVESELATLEGSKR